MKQTAVEWLVNRINKDFKNYDFLITYSNEIIQANEIFKQQVIDAHFQGVKETALNLSEHISIPKTLNNIQEIENGIGKHEEGEDYYNETFKNK
jgi:hypothetical protein